MVFGSTVEKLKISQNIFKYNFLNFQYFFKIVEDLEELDLALQKRLGVFFVSSNLARTARANVWVLWKIVIFLKNHDFNDF